MKFDKITFISENAYLQLLVEGECQFVDNGFYSNNQQVKFELDEVPQLLNNAKMINVNNITFSCSNLQLKEKTLIGDIVEIQSPEVFQ